MSSGERRGKRAEREEGRVDWKRGRWPDAKLKVASAKSDLGKEQQRVKREESRWFDPKMVGWARKGSVNRTEDGRAKREARRKRQARSR